MLVPNHRDRFLASNKHVVCCKHRDTNKYCGAGEVQDKLDKKANNENTNIDNMNMEKMNIGGDGSFVSVDFEIDEVDEASVLVGTLPSAIRGWRSSTKGPQRTFLRLRVQT